VLRPLQPRTRFAFGRKRVVNAIGTNLACRLVAALVRCSDFRPIALPCLGDPLTGAFKQAGLQAACDASKAGACVPISSESSRTGKSFVVRPRLSHLGNIAHGMKPLRMVVTVTEHEIPELADAPRLDFTPGVDS